MSVLLSGRKLTSELPFKSATHWAGKLVIVVHARRPSHDLHCEAAVRQEGVVPQRRAVHVHHDGGATPQLRLLPEAQLLRQQGGKRVPQSTWQGSVSRPPGGES